MTYDPYFALMNLLHGAPLSSLKCQISSMEPLFNWHTTGKEGVSLRSPWLSISRMWLKVEKLATFKLEMGTESPFGLTNGQIILLFLTVTQGFSKQQPFPTVLTNCWAISFRRLLKDNKAEDFQDLMGILHEKRTSSSQDRRFWSLEPNGIYSVKSLVKHLSPASPIDKQLEKALWKSKSL